MSVIERCLVEEAEREYKAVHMLATLPLMAAGVLGPAAGLDTNFCWYILRLKKQRAGSPWDGDIDLLAGPLEFDNQAEFASLFVEERKSRYDWHPTQVALLTAAKMAGKGCIKWPPSTNKLVAIEAKCVYLSPEATDISRQNLKLTKTSESKVAHTRAQVLSLLRMGFDRVALLDIIANPPASGLDGQAFVTALNVADLSRQALENDLNHRLPVHSPAGHYVWSIGSVAGGDEREPGAGYPVELQPAMQNPLLKDEEVKACRAAVNQSLQHELGKLPAPRNLRAIFVDCENCGKIHSDLDVCKPSLTSAADCACASRDSLRSVGAS
jgi:hypothetical protein